MPTSGALGKEKNASPRHPASVGWPRWRSRRARLSELCRPGPEAAQWRAPPLHRRLARVKEDKGSAGCPENRRGEPQDQACRGRRRQGRVQLEVAARRVLDRADCVGRLAGLQPGDGPDLWAPEVVVSGARDTQGRRKGAHGRSEAWACGPEQVETACGTACRGPEELVVRWGLLGHPAMW
ncbi:hypothetical protein NDU88_003050 [Pleurodeles waltl]|uniref:Uncharacterized protein n=1 Tax=Pleurodeles waltl TaxID=8319 RepID=A0AAV7UBA8_PLEWA|nr:hypothetical protein NDU88_003050 [Pleurodeles waltl]